MNLFGKRHVIKKAIKAGGNVTFIAANVATIFAVVEQDNLCKTFNFKQKLALTSICDMYSYIIDEESTSNEIVGYTKTGYNRSNANDKDVILTEIVIEICRLIFQIHNLAPEYVVDDFLENKKEKVFEVVTNILNSPKESPIYNEVYANITRWLRVEPCIDLAVEAVNAVWLD